MIKRRHTRTLAGPVSLGCILVASISSAQDAGGLQAFATFRESLIYSDNPDLIVNGDSETISRTDLSFGLTSTTRSSALEFTVGGAIEAGDRRGDSTDFVDADVRLGFTQTSQSSELALLAQYTESDVSDVPDPDTTDGELEFGLGTRENLFTSIGYQGGLNAPFSYGFNLNHRETDYRDTIDPGLVAEEETTVALNFGFRVNSQLTLGVEASVIDFSDESLLLTDRETRRLAFTANYDIRPDLTVTAGLNRTEIETTTTGGTTSEDGFGANLGFEMDRINGTLAGGISTTLEESGRVSAIEFTRSLELRNATLSFGAGLTDTETDGINPLFNVSYFSETPLGSFDISLSQRADVDSASRDRIDTRVEASYMRAINSVSSWDASLMYTESDVLGAADFSERVDIGLNYRHDIGSEWDFVSGYTYTRISEDGVADRDSNTFRISLERSFSFRP